MAKPSTGQDQYLDRQQYPKTTRLGMHLMQQLRADAQQLAELTQLEREGEKLNPDQQQMLWELRDKARRFPMMLHQKAAPPESPTASSGQ